MERFKDVNYMVRGRIVFSIWDRELRKEVTNFPSCALRVAYREKAIKEYVITLHNIQYTDDVSREAPRRSEK
jgi:hypothetical protein